ncbi:uncharacterized protein MYCFIDRAFT_189949 [Pseudocercospora fijiensis CIRAD86]|uniref:Uncharacterized protein n=1 Tax=Pseudocercospora fijiensis (strain CIRAD86) TaxID=383855 RepID=M2YRQ5_PSEFD|nr:uncharacterized protein MYCFIDRAFT_189949 [Pseudocercospora fijiensis CIRAD86]EME80405.1 hypothetical protein MYCFIDRAFT_189949 [Pseudocercospora fijiensis CIRAD86]
MHSDDWHLENDPKKRKRIQDRLAQRVRRKRLREARNTDKTRQEVRDGLASNIAHFVYDAPFVRISLAYEIPAPITIFGALFINGKVLGLSCFSQVATRSSPASPDVPLSLRPTATQLLTLHLTGIDRFPFPKMRDNYINMGGLIDEEDFSLDIFTKPSFDIKPGGPAWDPDAWIPAKSFLEKWGFLMQ